MSKYEISSARGAEALLGRYGAGALAQEQEKGKESEAEGEGRKSAPEDTPGMFERQESTAMGHGFIMARDSEEELPGPKLSVNISQKLDRDLEDALHRYRRMTGIKLKKANVLRDGIQNFVYGRDLKCPSGHRFIVPPQEFAEARKIFLCPICGMQVAGE